VSGSPRPSEQEAGSPQRKKEEEGGADFPHPGGEKTRPTAGRKESILQISDPAEKRRGKKREEVRRRLPPFFF